MEKILTSVAFVVTGFIASKGYLAIIVLMGLESANIPIPSEVIMPYAGFLASSGSLNIHLVALAGAVGCLIGSILSYYLGIKLGRPFLWKYGKWMLVSQKDILIAEKFMEKCGDLTFFITRVLPVVRTFISFVIGVARGNFYKFLAYTFIGSWIWSYALAYVGLKLGDNWHSIKGIWYKFDKIIIAIILLGIAFHIYRVFRDSRSRDQINKIENPAAE